MRLAAILALCTCCAFADEKPAPRDAAVIAVVRDSFWDAFRKKDVETLRRVMADDYFEPTASGTVAKANVLAIVTKIDFKDFTLDHFKVIWAGKNDAIVSYEAHQHWTLNGEEGPPHLRASTAVENRGGKWVIVFHQETIAK